MEVIAIPFLFLGWFTFAEVLLDRRVSPDEWAFVVIGHLVLAALVIFLYRRQRRSAEAFRREFGESSPSLFESPGRIFIIPGVAYGFGVLGAFLF